MNAFETRLRAILAPFSRPSRSEAIVQEKIPEPEPRVTLWQRLAISLGAPGVGPKALASEASYRVASRTGCAGRPYVNYASALAAAADHRMWLLEIARASAESRLAVAIDDVDGAFGTRAAVDVARAEVEALRRREYVARELLPLGARYALESERLDAERDLAALAPTPERARVEYVPPKTTSVRAVRSTNDPVTADEMRAKAAMRDVARENARDHSTPFSRAQTALFSVESRIERWDVEHPKLARALADEVAR